MKYSKPMIVNQHNAIAAILGQKAGMGFDSQDPSDVRSTSTGYESDE